MKRIPVVPTVIVLMAVAIMIGLGVWQLQRKSLKESLLARYAAGDRAGAWETFARMLPVLAFTRQHLDVSIHFHKQLMYRRGIFATPRVRKRTIPWDESWQRCADELIERVLAEERASGEGR